MTVPATHLVDAIHALETLDHGALSALAALFHEWAFHDSNLNPDQRTQVLLWSIDYENLANYCGPDWRAPNPGSEPDARQFIARHAMRMVRDSRLSRVEPRPA
jgi:hypothetical protein